MEVAKGDLLRRAEAARRGALRPARRLLQGRPQRRGHRRPARPGREPGRPSGVRGQAPPAAQGQLSHDRTAVRRVKVVVNVDGGARGNPGPAAVAAVATSPEGDRLGERNAYIGEATNNVAEYRALLLGLELARDLGAAEVEVVNDSELVARQIGGGYKVKHARPKPLYLETMRALREFDRWAVRSVRREQNTRADELVNEALDEALGA